jgi:hypothetical protein
VDGDIPIQREKKLFFMNVGEAGANRLAVESAADAGRDVEDWVTRCNRDSEV